MFIRKSWPNFLWALSQLKTTMKSKSNTLFFNIVSTNILILVHLLTALFKFRQPELIVHQKYYPYFYWARLNLEQKWNQTVIIWFPFLSVQFYYFLHYSYLSITLFKLHQEALILYQELVPLFFMSIALIKSDEEIKQW